MTFAEACRTAFWLLLAGRDLRRRADRDWIRAREADQVPALPPSDAGVVGHRPLEDQPLPEAARRALYLETHFRLTHPDYDTVLARAGIWRLIDLVRCGVPLTAEQEAVLDRIRREPNPAEAAYGLALTRIATGETE